MAQEIWSLSFMNQWTKNTDDLEIGALYVMTNRGKWHIDVYPKVVKSVLAPDTERHQFIGQPDTLYYGPIPWPDKELIDWPRFMPPSNVIYIKKQ